MRTDKADRLVLKLGIPPYATVIVPPEFWLNHFLNLRVGLQGGMVQNFIDGPWCPDLCKRLPGITQSRDGGNASEECADDGDEDEVNNHDACQCSDASPTDGD